eukprot:scaffold105008_cov54-Phaeocystis_antarctica.AAC.4
MVKPVPQAEGAFPLPGYTYHDTYHAAGGGSLPLCAANPNPNPNPNQAEGPFPYALVARAEAQCYFELPDEVGHVT